jgi:5'(3')-deoxyribonucleotidase
MNKKVKIFVDMDGVLCDYDKSRDEALEKYPKIIYPQAVYGFFADMSPILDAVDSYMYLHERFDVRILTAPSYKNPLCYTEKRVWVGKHLGIEAAKKMIICPDKSLLMGQYLIDDIAYGKAQQHNFIGELIHFDSHDYPNWLSVIHYFNTKYVRGR